MSEADPHRAIAAVVDSKAIGQQVRAIVRSLDRMRRSEAYWHVGSVVGEVRHVLEQAWTLLRADEGRQAIAVLQAITQAYLMIWEHMDDSDGEASGFFRDLTLPWTEAMLSVDLSAKERKKWVKQFGVWQEEVGAYGVEEVFQAPAEAVLAGWDDPVLQRMLQGECREPEDWDDELSFYEEILTNALLAILERRKQFQEYLALAQAERFTAQAVSMFVQLGRVDEALAYAQVHIGSAEEVLVLATALEEHGERENSLLVAEKGLHLPGDQVALARWLRDNAASLGDRSLALRAAEIVFRQEMSLKDYRRVATLAKEQWPDYRIRLLEFVRQKAATRSEQAVPIFLYEKLLDDAVAALDQYASHTIVEQMVDAALREHQILSWVIEACRKQAEYLMDGGKSQYYFAALPHVTSAFDVLMDTAFCS